MPNRKTSRDFVEFDKLPELRAVPICTGLFAGADGSLYGNRWGKWYRLKTQQFKDAKKLYLRINIEREDQKKTHQVHRLIAMAWHGMPPNDKPEIRHLDGNPRNNVPENLKWGSKTENEQDKRGHGTIATGEKHWSKTKPESIPRGENHPAAVLNEDQVARIKAELIRLNRRGTSQRLAKEYGVSRNVISDIRHGHHWACVKPDTPEGLTTIIPAMTRVAQHALQVLRETNNPSLSRHDVKLIHLVAERAGLAHTGPSTCSRVINCIDNSNRGYLIKGFCREGKMVRRFWRPECFPDQLDPRSTD